DGGRIDGLDRGVGAGQQRGDRQDHEGQQRGGQPQPQQQREQGDQAQGGQGAGGPGGGHRHALAAVGVAHQQADRDRAHRRHSDPEHGVAEVLERAHGDPGGSRPPLGLGQPGQGLAQRTLVHAARTSLPTVHGISMRPASTRRPSMNRASATVSTTPVRISATMPRRNPSTNSMPRLETPRTPPTVTREIVDTATTRTPASSTRPARGSSSRQKRAGGASPWAVAELSTSRPTERKASEAAGTISASPYSVRATEMFSGLRKPVPSRPGSSTNNGRDGIAYNSPERVVTPLRSQPMRLASLAS